MKRQTCILTIVLASCFVVAQARGSAACAVADDENVAAKSEVVFQLGERDFFPEGIAYNPDTERFYLGSRLKRKIISVSTGGDVTTFAAPAADGLCGVLGLQVDRARRVLWAASRTSQSMDGFDAQITPETGVFKYSLVDGELINKYTIEMTDTNHLMNDIALAQDGTVYITSFSYGTIYRITNESDRLEEWCEMPADVWTNGIDISEDDRYLFVAGNDDYYRITTATGEVRKLEMPAGVEVGGADGLYYYNNSLVAVAARSTEGQPDYHIVRLRLSDNMDEIIEVNVLEEDNPLWDFPTTGVIIDNSLYYIATAQFRKLSKDGVVAPWNELSDIYILKICLE